MESAYSDDELHAACAAVLQIVAGTSALIQQIRHGQQVGAGIEVARYLRGMRREWLSTNNPHVLSTREQVDTALDELISAFSTVGIIFDPEFSEPAPSSL